MKRIPLTKGQFAIVDDEDYERISAHKWYAALNPHTKSFCAMRRSKKIEHSKSQMVYMHREVMKAKSSDRVDHINHDTLDNRKINLRICTNSQNLANVAIRAGNKSGFKGVYWHKASNKWMARVGVKGETKYLGCHNTIEDAARAYDAAAIKHHGAFALTNKMLGLLP